MYLSVYFYAIYMIYIELWSMKWNKLYLDANNILFFIFHMSQPF